MTFRELLMEGRRRLEAAGVEEAENDARLLLLDTYRIDWCSLVSVYEMRVPVNPPTPPTPKTATLLLRNLSKAASPSSIRVLENISSIVLKRDIYR